MAVEQTKAKYLALDADSLEGSLTGEVKIKLPASSGLVLSGGVAIQPDTVSAGDIAPVSVTANGAGLDVSDLDGDHLDITLIPTNYTRDATPPEADTVVQLAAHLAGIDTALGSLSGGRTWKQLVLHNEQLHSGTDGLGQAIALNINTQVLDGDTLRTLNGPSSIVFTFKDIPVSGTDVQIGANVDATMENLAAVYVLNGLDWTAVTTTGIQEYFGTSPAPGGTKSVIVIRKTQAVSGMADRLYGTLAGGQSGIRVLNFSDASEYRRQDAVEEDLDSADGTVKQFGFGTVSTALVTNETHTCSSDNDTYTWDDTSNLWVQTNVGALTAGDGILISGVEVSVKPDVTTGGDIAPVTVSANGTGLDVSDLNGDHLDISFNPDRYGPDDSIAEADDPDDLSAHLKGINDAIEYKIVETHLVTFQESGARGFRLLNVPKDGVVGDEFELIPAYPEGPAQIYESTNNQTGIGNFVLINVTNGTGKIAPYNTPGWFVYWGFSHQTDVGASGAHQVYLAGGVAGTGNQGSNTSNPTFGISQGVFPLEYLKVRYVV